MGKKSSEKNHKHKEEEQIQKENLEATMENEEDKLKDKEEEKVSNNGEKAEPNNKEDREEEKSGIADPDEKIRELQEKYLRLSAEFDNYRKRTLKERTELFKSAGEETISKVLPVLDDFERALSSMEEATDVEAVKSGVKLIYNKLKETLVQQGLKEIPAQGEEFDTDMHEAITKIPAPDKKLKGKIVDVVEKGYYLNDKVIRYSKVVIGE